MRQRLAVSRTNQLRNCASHDNFHLSRLFKNGSNIEAKQWTPLPAM